MLQKFLTPQFLTPHLAETMPGIATVLPWLFLFDAMFLIGAHVAAFVLTVYKMPLTPEDARQLAGGLRHDRIRMVHCSLVCARRLLLGLGVGTILIWLGLSLTTEMREEWNELFIRAVFGGVFLPNYISVRLLERTFKSLVERVEYILRPSKPPAD